MSQLPLLAMDHGAVEPVELAVIARGLRKVYQSYPAATSESGGVFGRVRGPDPRRAL